MSWTEIRQREGMPYGGMPHDALLQRLEETDPALVEPGRPLRGGIPDKYDDYVRSEIIDWAPDAPYLESDQTRRDPAWSRSLLNLRYNATRGSNPELPRHPEMFIGFTGDDPRGASTDPRFEQVRGHVTSRAADLTTRMGDNDDHHLAERPWTGQSISYEMKNIHRRLVDSTKVFSVQKEGRPWGRNSVADALAGGGKRAGRMAEGDEALAYRTEDRFNGGDQGSAADRLGADAHRVNVGIGADSAPWHNTTGDADLAVQRYGPAAGSGRSHYGGPAVGGGRLATQGPDQNWSATVSGRAGNRQSLGATMALAARYQKAVRAGRHEHDPVEGAGREGQVAGGALAPGRDPGLARRRAGEDQTRRPATEVQDSEAITPGAGIVPSSDLQRPRWASTAGVSSTARLANAEAVIAGFREGSAAARRRIASRVQADGTRVSAPDRETTARRGATPGANTERAARKGTATHTGSSGAGRAGVTRNAGAVPQRPDQRVGNARRGNDPSQWRTPYEAGPVPKSKHPEWRSQTQGQTVLGDDSEQVFGADAAVSAAGAATGPKTLRPAGWTERASEAMSDGDTDPKRYDGDPRRDRRAGRGYAAAAGWASDGDDLDDAIGA